MDHPKPTPLPETLYENLKDLDPSQDPSGRDHGVRPTPTGITFTDARGRACEYFTDGSVRRVGPDRGDD